MLHFNLTNAESKNYPFLTFYSQGASLNSMPLEKYVAKLKKNFFYKLLKTGSTFHTTYIHKMFYIYLSHTVFSLYTFSSSITCYHLCQMLSVMHSYFFLSQIFEIFLLSLLQAAKCFLVPQTFWPGRQKVLLVAFLILILLLKEPGNFYVKNLRSNFIFTKKYC